jgi:hypothetical protein
MFHLLAGVFAAFKASALDEVVVTEISPLYSCYGRIGQQVSIPITCSRARKLVLFQANFD